MKKKVTISIISIVIILLIPICSFLYYDLFVGDDWGSGYNQSWKSEDGSITFVTDNKKGLMGCNNCYDGVLNIDGKKIDVDILYGGGFSITSKSREIEYLYGDYSYIPIIGKLTVEIESTSIDNLSQSEEVVFYRE
ncbi:MAG: hypothetical protein ACI4HM_04380 [Ruminococcus sp.]